MSRSGIPDFDALKDVSTHEFAVPRKCIHEGSDVPIFLVSHAYRDVLAFLVRLNRAMFPLSVKSSANAATGPQTFPLDGRQEAFPSAVKHLQDLLRDLDKIVEEAPPDPGPRRFGNVSFRTWSNILEQRSHSLLEEHLRDMITMTSSGAEVSPLDEIGSYLLGGFGSAQRLDYGTGHELSFLAFLGCIWKLGGFGDSPTEDDSRGIVLGVIQPYLQLIRKLITTYNLEPAGSHGVWGLDDHSFLPYIFGSAQYGPATKAEDPTPVEGSFVGAPDPGSVTSASVVERERSNNMYFGAIGFINDVKKGPFWEHSPTLYDISGVRAGWGKINKGMLKMYDAEVLGKFPVVQHFPFGSLFSFEKDPTAKPPTTTVHTTSQPQRQSTPSSAAGASTVRALYLSSKARLIHQTASGTQSPWAKTRAAAPPPREPPNLHKPLRDPLAEGMSGTPVTKSGESSAQSASMPPPTKAPWAK